LINCSKSGIGEVRRTWVLCENKMSAYNIMFLVKFFKKHQKKILLLLIILAVLFLLNRQFKILEGLESKEKQDGRVMNDPSAIKSLDDLKKMMAAQIEMAK